MICKLRGALLGDRTMSGTPSQARSGRFLPVHLKHLPKGARNSIGVWWLPSDGKCWGVHPCPRAENPDLGEEEPLSQAVRTQHTPAAPVALATGPSRDSAGRASCQDSRNPVERAGAYLRALWATCGRLLRTSSTANGKQSDCAHPPGAPARSWVEKVR